MAKQERGIAVREAILQGAARVFDRKHYERARIEDVLEEASITRGSLYFHFEGGKRQIAEEIIRRQDAGFVQLRDLATALKGDGLRCMLELGRLLAIHLRADPVARAGVRLVVQASDRFPDLARMPHPTWIEAVESLLLRAREDGSLRPDVDISSVARALVYLFIGAQTSSCIGGDWEGLPETVGATLTVALLALATPAYLERSARERSEAALTVSSPRGDRGRGRRGVRQEPRDQPHEGHHDHELDEGLGDHHERGEAEGSR